MILRVRRGLETNRTQFTPALGEPLFTTDTKRLYIGDGITPGGIATGSGGSGGEPGADGREIEIRRGTTHIQWRYVGTPTWQNLMALAELRGDPGTPGIPGVKGDRGERGYQGLQGDSGYTPIKGVDYFDGAKGNTGEQGIQGAKGDTGEQGEKGDTGEQGIQGIQGVQGEKGDTGDKGEKGDKGDKGDTGDTGAPGAGLPVGGASGQILTKNTPTDYDYEWKTPAYDPTDHGLLTGLGDDDHTQYHTDARGDVRYYQKSEVDTQLSGKSPTSHNHDDRYYTETETNSLLNGKANTSHTHPIADITATGTRSASTYLNGSGAFSTPPNTNTTYTEITEAEITAGTASTLRTMTGRRIGFLKSWVSSAISALTKSDIGLGNVDNTADADKPTSAAQQAAINDAVNAAMRAHNQAQEQKVKWARWL